jgi:hypothetical protein
MDHICNPIILATWEADTERVQFYWSVLLTLSRPAVFSQVSLLALHLLFLYRNFMISRDEILSFS